jgi:hypothetical protein
VRIPFISLLAVVLVISLSGCNMPAEGPDLSTQVAATLEALDAPSPGLTPAGTVVGEAPGPESTPLPAIPTDPGPGVLSIAYINAGQVWFVQEGGTPVQLTSSGDVQQVVLSQDAQLVVFERYEPATGLAELKAVDTLSATEVVLLSQADLDGLFPLGGAVHRAPYQFEFIPGTHTLLLNTHDTFEGPGLAQNNELWSIDVDTSTRSLLLDRGLGGDFYISPAADMLALVQATSIGFANIDGTGRSPDHLTYPSIITYSEYQYYPIPVWTADGSAVDIVIPGEDPFVDTTARVWHVPVSGTASPRVDLPGFSYFRNSDKTPMLSPDLTKAAFLRETAPNTFDLVVAPLDGSPESIFASGDIAWQGWNPDSARVAYRDLPMNLMLTGPGLTPSGLGFGTDLRWVDVDSYLYLDQLTATHRFGLVNMPSSVSELDTIAGPSFDYDFTR